MTDSLAGLRVAITGAARGIGLATATELHARGAHVIIGDVDATAARNAAAGLGGSAQAHQLDVADRASYAAFLDKAATGGPVDVLINNAGIMPIGRFVDQPPAVYQRVLEINVLGHLHGLHLALPAMIERGRGHIINVASTAGKVAIPGGLAYCAAKSAVVALTETARIEYAATGIDFTCVLPNFTDTELIDGTAGMRFVPTVQPSAVAKGIVRAIEKKRDDVFVPAVVGPMLRSQALLGRRLRDLVNRKMGAYDAFLTFDPERRAAYEQRVRES